MQFWKSLAKGCLAVPPIGLGALMFAAQTTPAGARSNIAAWLQSAGYNDLPGWLVAKGVDATVFWVAFFCIGVYLAAVAFWLIHRSRARPAPPPVQPREDAPSAAQRDRAQMASLLVSDRQRLADRVSEIASATITHPGGNQSYSIFDKAVALRDRFMSEVAFPPLWQAFEDAVLRYLMRAPPLPTGPTDTTAQRAALAHEEKFRPPITASAQALTRYLLYQG